MNPESLYFYVQYVGRRDVPRIMGALSLSGSDESFLIMDYGGVESSPVAGMAITYIAYSQLNNIDLAKKDHPLTFIALWAKSRENPAKFGELIREKFLGE